jgi:hypothetical protein
MIIEAQIATLREMHAAYSKIHPNLDSADRLPHISSGDLIMPHSWAESAVPWAIALEIGSPPPLHIHLADPRDAGSMHFGMHQDMRVAAHVGEGHFACFWVESWEWQRVTEEQLLAALEDHTNGQH